jgi:hypothetical protein
VPSTSNFINSIFTLPFTPGVLSAVNQTWRQFPNTRFQVRTTTQIFFNVNYNYFRKILYSDPTVDTLFPLKITIKIYLDSLFIYYLTPSLKRCSGFSFS